MTFVAISTSFDSLPIETNQHIASYLDTDLDICCFRQICGSTRDAIDGDRLFFWRRRFLKFFDAPAESSNYPDNAKYKQNYQQRKGWLKHGAVFAAGHEDREKACLTVLRDLINDSFRTSIAEREKRIESLNIQHIRRFMGANNLLQIIFNPQIVRRQSCGDKPRQNRLLTTIQVLMAPMLLSLEPEVADHHYGFPDSQFCAYSQNSTHPIFSGCNGLDIDMTWVLHQVNFWRYHMCRESEHTLFLAFSELEEHERPRLWQGALSQEMRHLGANWKGSYAYVERPDLKRIRRGKGEEYWIQDLFAGEDSCFAFQDMRLEALAEGEATWPAQFEEHLRSLKPPPSRVKTRAQKGSAAREDVAADFAPLSFRFSGSGNDVTENFRADGWLNPLPPQQGVPGWHRMTMMKYFDDEDGVIDSEALWAYEGVVLPGGQMILGRWWSPSNGTREPMYSGPFILWCVDEAERSLSG